MLQFYSFWALSVPFLFVMFSLSFLLQSLVGQREENPENNFRSTLLIDFKGSDRTGESQLLFHPPFDQRIIRAWRGQRPPNTSVQIQKKIALICLVTAMKIIVFLDSFDVIFRGNDESGRDQFIMCFSFLVLVRLSNRRLYDKLLRFFSCDDFVFVLAGVWMTHGWMPTNRLLLLFSSSFLYFLRRKAKAREKTEYRRCLT